MRYLPSIEFSFPFQAFRGIKCFVDKLEKVSENPDLEAEMGKEWVISSSFLNVINRSFCKQILHCSSSNKMTSYKKIEIRQIHELMSNVKMMNSNPTI